MNSLQELRKRKGMTLSQLSGKTSVSLRTLNEYEAGKRPIALAHLRAIAKALWVSPDDITRPPQQPPPADIEEEPRVAETLIATSGSTAASEMDDKPASARSAIALPERDAETRAAEMRPLTRSHQQPDRGRPGKPRQAARPVEPITPGQASDIARLAKVLDLSDDELVSQLGSPVSEATRPQARRLIVQLRGQARERGLTMASSKPEREKPDYEESLLTSLRDRGAVLEIQLFNGERYRGQISDFSPYIITIKESNSGSEIILRKLAMTHYRVIDQIRADDEGTDPIQAEHSDGETD